MRQYLIRLAELIGVTFLGAALPVFVTNGFDKAAVSGALSAGVAAVYGLLVKGKGEPDRPTVK